MRLGDQKLSDGAYEFIKQHRADLIQSFASKSIPVNTPISLFMAGSPGVGKTEVSRKLMEQFETVPVRIDADEIRSICPGYMGANAYLFQQAATKGVHMLYDYALEKKLHLILDGTFAYSGALDNIQRSIRKNRRAELWFVYQDPLKAWEFTKAREVLEHRQVSKETFVKAFLNSKVNVLKAKEEFGPKVQLNLLVKNLDNSDESLKLNIQSHELDRYIGRAYSLEELTELIV